MLLIFTSRKTEHPAPQEAFCYNQMFTVNFHKLKTNLNSGIGGSKFYIAEDLKLAVKSIKALGKCLLR